VTALPTPPLVLIAVPLLGAAIGMALRKKPDALKIWLLLVAMASLASIGWAAGRMAPQAAGLPLLSFLPVMAFVTLLGQPIHPSLSAAWLLTMGLLGLALGVLAGDSALSALCAALLLGTVACLIWQSRAASARPVWWEMGPLALGAFGAVIAVLTAPSVSSVALALACAAAFPLVPFHKGYVAALMTLPGNLPAFLAVALPLTGFHLLQSLLPQLPGPVSDGLVVPAFVGCLYGSLRALGQTRMAAVIAYGSVAFLSIPWAMILGSRLIGSHTLVFVLAVTSATSGLLLASFVLRARYGEVGLRGLGGLAQPMPRFAVVLTLLALAAVGLPPFGVFAGFFGLLLTPSLAWSPGLAVILAGWLAASWYLFDMTQELLFGRPTVIRRHHDDLRQPELTALTAILLVLTLLGLLPARLFDPGTADPHRTVVMEAPPWNR
jgi:NADH-quinone oxidoreductase subunit M